MLRGSSRRIACAVALASFACTATATAAGSGVRNQYKWRDGSGALHYSDALPAEAAKYGYEVVNGQGIVIRRVERAKTPEELAVAKAEQARDRAQREEAATRSRTDAQLLSAYPSETDLQHAQQQKLELLDQQVESARISLRSQEQALADQLAHAAEVERNGKTLPEPQAKLIADTRKQIDVLRAAMTRRENERAAAAAAMEAERVHYRELKAKSAEDRP